MDYIAAAVLLLIFGVFVFSIVSGFFADKKLKRRLISSFGMPPTDMDYELDGIKTYSSYKGMQAMGGLRVDDMTWNDLDMDSVFRRINTCLTSVGEEYLYDCLHEPRFSQDRLLDREQSIRFFDENPDERLAVQMCLVKLKKTAYNSLSSLIFHPDSRLFKHPFLFNILSVLPYLSCLTFFHSIAAGITSIFLSFAINLVVYYISKKRVDVETHAIGYFASVLACCGKLLKRKDIGSLPVMVDMKKHYDIFRSLRGRLPVPKIGSGTDLETLQEYFNILFLTDIRHYNRFIKRIIRHNDDFHALFKALGELDLSICVSSFRKSLIVSSTPVFHEQNAMEFTELYHPLIPAPVKNSGVLSNDSLITGSNASGKSTFIKALAVNGILAQTIFTCTAQRFATRFSYIVTSMAMRDDISSGESYFIVEVGSLKRIMDHVRTIPCICYIDEILRGTNTIERIAASASVLEYLHSQDCLCIAASHDIELTNILVGKIDNYHFCEQIMDDGIAFDYTLRQGPSTTRNAIKLLDYMEFDAGIVNRAEALVAAYEEKRAW